MKTTDLLSESAVLQGRCSLFFYKPLFKLLRPCPSALHCLG